MRTALCFLLAAAQLVACSWDYPVWTKSKLSDTPLFRFVINERFGAGYIDRQGHIVIPPQFMVFGNPGADFFEGLANVTTKDKADFYIDATGKHIAKSDFLSTGDYSNGLATRWFRESRKYGYINHAGKLVIPAVFDAANTFREGLARIEISGHWGFIDPTGKLVIPAKFGSAWDFADGHALVILNGPCQYMGYGPCENFPYSIRGPAPRPKVNLPQAHCHYSAIDKTGRVLFTSEFIDAKPYAEGLAPMGDGAHWGFVDYNGHIQIPLQFENAEPFSEGLARVRIGEKWGFIDHQGKFVIPPQFDYVQDFSDGMAVVTGKSDKSWFIDKKGNRAIPGEFDAASSFVMGLAHVRVGQDYYSSRWSYIEKSGKAVFSYFDQSDQGRIKK